MQLGECRVNLDRLENFARVFVMFESQNRDCLSPENVGAGGGRVLDRESKKESTREIECEKLTRVQTRSPRQAYPAHQYFGSSEDNYSSVCVSFSSKKNVINATFEGSSPSAQDWA